MNRMCENGGKNLKVDRKKNARSSYLKTSDKKLDELLMKRYVPVDIYLDTDDPKALEAVNESVKSVLESLDMEIYSDPEIFKGSIIEKFWAVSKSVASNIDVINKIAGMISSLKGRGAELKNERIFSKKVPAIDLSDTLKYLKDVPNISIRIGSLLVTKSTTRDIPLIQFKNLSREEVMILDNNPGILKNPRTIHHKLNTIKNERLISSRIAMSL